ncbi:MAG: peptidylprolyl isomerase, partial [Planctomycetota bacterium]
MRTVIREPLVHFFLIGAALFALFAVLDDSPPPAAENMLVVSEDDARRLAAEFGATWHRLPTVEELDHMIGERVREEVYVREALVLGLDRDDAVVRRRLQTQMEFLTESGAKAVHPDQATLQAHLEAHSGRFAEPPLVAFEQILLDERIGGEEVALVAARLNRGIDPGTAARPTLLPPMFRPSPVQAVDGNFGSGFFDALGALPVGLWAGPVETSLGRHLVRVTERRAARLPPLAEIRARVEQDWRAEFTARLREERYEALLSRYEVVPPGPAAPPRSGIGAP